MFECLKLYAGSSETSVTGKIFNFNTEDPLALGLLLGIVLLTLLVYSYIAVRIEYPSVFKRRSKKKSSLPVVKLEDLDNPERITLNYGMPAVKAENPERVKVDYVVRDMTEDKGTGKRVWVLETERVSGENSEQKGDRRLTCGLFLK